MVAPPFLCTARPLKCDVIRLASHLSFRPGTNVNSTHANPNEAEGAPNLQPELSSALEKKYPSPQ